MSVANMNIFTRNQGKMISRATSYSQKTSNISTRHLMGKLQMQQCTDNIGLHWNEKLEHTDEKWFSIFASLHFKNDRLLTFIIILILKLVLFF